MQDWDWDYFAGRDIEYPQGRPSKPVMPKNPTPTALREYADELESYEALKSAWNRAVKKYQDAVAARQAEFRAELRKTGDFTDEQFDLLWSEAWELGHSSGLNEVAYHFDELHGLVLRWEAAKK